MLLQFNGLARNRNLLLRVSNVRSFSVISNAGTSVQDSAPSSKTTVLINRLPLTATETILKAAYKDVPLRKVLMQPGCVTHWKNSAAAEEASKLLKEKYDIESQVGQSSLPALFLENVPSDVTPEVILDAFKDFQPSQVKFSGISSLQIAVTNSADALKISNVIESNPEAKYHNVLTNISELNKGNYVVQVFNLDTKTTWKQLETDLKSALGDEFVSNLKVIHQKSENKSVRVRLYQEHNLPRIVSTLEGLKIQGQKISISEPYWLKHPAIFIRNVSDLSEAKLRPYLSSLNPRRINISYKTEFLMSETVVLYFNNETDALSALKNLKTTTIEGKKLQASYRLVPEPELLVKNVPVSVSDNDLKELLTIRTVVHVSSKPSKGTDRDVNVLLTSPSAMDNAKMALERHGFTVEYDGVHSFMGLTIDLPEGLETDDSFLLKEIEKTIKTQESNFDQKNLTLETNKQAFISFLTLKEAAAAKEAFVSGKVSIKSALEFNGTTTASKISSQLTFSLDSTNLNVETPLSDVLTTLKSSPLCVSNYFIEAQRIAIAKFRRHMHVVPGIKQMKSVDIDGKKVSVSRYYPDVTEPVSEYDLKGVEEEFDRMTLRTLLADNMRSDPANRYQLAKNLFERSLADAQSQGNVNSAVEYLLSNTPSSDLKKEAARLLSQRQLNQNDRTRLFELFLQRDDMYTFLSDFENFSNAFGKMDESNVYDWSQFDILADEDVVKIKNAMLKREAELEANPDPNSVISVKDYLDDQKKTEAQPQQAAHESLPDFDIDDYTFGAIPSSNKKDKYQDDDEVIIRSQTGTDQKISLLDPTTLTDRDGRPWSGVILDTDTTQKITPGNRILSHRALVMIGNLRGAGGFGVGKGPSADKAIEAAFRDALRNLIFIDLYENSCLAHDLYGKHNNCHAYLRATQKSRVMVASPFVESILIRFGIASASVKIVGRRNPYSIVRAIFNALSKHENLDEYAKSRGKRYLTLQWAMKNNI